MRDTEAIILPPLRPPERRRGRLPLWLWAVILLVMLGLGFGAGALFQREKGIGGSDGDGGTPADDAAAGLVASIDSVAGVGGPASVVTRDKIADLLLAARLAMADEDWVGAQLRYERVLEIDSDNTEAQATLPRIADRLEAQHGGMVVTTDPVGATVKLGGETGVTAADKPLRFEKLSVGRQALEIKLDGYEPVVREVIIKNGVISDLGSVVLERSAGSLRVSSQPSGVNYVVRRLNAGEAAGGGTGPESQVVLRGTTPAEMPELTVGRYEVLMALAGWPDHSEIVEVRNNRETDVSHVFARGGLQIISDPSGAQVWLLDANARATADVRSGRLLGETPLSLADVPSGRHRLALTYDDWAPIQRTVEVVADDALKLEFAWKRGLVSFISEPPGAEVYLRGERVGTLEDRTPFQWEFPEGDYPFHAVLPKTDLEGVDVTWSVRADVDNQAQFDFGYGSVVIRTDPPGATVRAGDTVVGTTPFVQPLVKPGDYTYTLRKENHAGAEVSGEVEPGQELAFNVKLKYDPHPESGLDFTNSERMKLRWIEGLRGWVGVHEVHQRAYEAVMSANPSYFRGLDRPVESLSWNDAAKFCEKLNAAEKARRKLPEGYIYRLPTDEEWTYFAADADLDSAITSRDRTLAGTSSVGASKRQFGLYDVRGNVWGVGARDGTHPASSTEWARPAWSAIPRWSLPNTNLSAVARGAAAARTSWRLSGGRPLKPTTGDMADVGFRVVLMPSQ